MFLSRIAGPILLSLCMLDWMYVYSRQPDITSMSRKLELSKCQSDLMYVWRYFFQYKITRWDATTQIAIFFPSKKKSRFVLIQYCNSIVRLWTCKKQSQHILSFKRSRKLTIYYDLHTTSVTSSAYYKVRQFSVRMNINNTTLTWEYDDFIITFMNNL